MPERELYRDKIELSLDGRQVFYLFFGGAVLFALVFVLGVFVGKRAEAMNRPGPAPAGDTLASLDERAELDLAFSEALLGDGTTALGPVDVALAPKPATGAKPAAKPEKSASAAAKATVHAKPVAQETKEPEAKKPAAVKNEEQEQKKEEAKATEEKAKEAPKAPSFADSAGSTARPADAEFTLQLASFNDRAGADGLYAKLAAAGYKPYLDRAEVEGEVFFRVRLGYYASWDDAVKAKTEFERREHIIAYVTPL